jgi:DNA-binding NtrC family response regulator
VSVNWDEQLPITGHVIVIEDDPVVRMLMEETLAELGYTSTSFDNAAAAMTHLEAVDGDCALIIADQGLPRGVQGTELISLANERWLIPSILTSGYEIELHLISPSTTYLQKPYTLDQLENTIASTAQRNPLLNI